MLVVINIYKKRMKELVMRVLNAIRVMPVRLSAFGASTFINDMAYPTRQVFTPFVVVVGGKYFLPVSECLLFDLENR